MAKKLIGIAVIVIMLFGIFGLTACTDSLAEYKSIKSQALQDYANAKEESNYCETGWAAIGDAVTGGKKAIQEATNKLTVDTTFKSATDAIDEIQGKETMTEILQLFNLADSKEIWNGSFEDVQFDGLSKGSFWIGISITFRQVKDGESYPELEAKHFGMINIVSFTYTHRVPDPSWSESVDFRQTGVVYITDFTPEAFTTAIRHLESLGFIKSAMPVNTVYL